MARQRISMKPVRKIIELSTTGKLSNRQISKLTGVSRPVVSQYIEAFNASGLGWQGIQTMTDSDLLKHLVKQDAVMDPRLVRLQACFPEMVKELSRVGVTRELLWIEYRQQHQDGYEYSQFCHHFKSWCGKDPEVTLHIDEKAGDRMYVDFTGETRSYWDNGIERQAELFVAVLGASQYTYVEATPSQRKDDFILANRNALVFFGGAPAAIVPDCLKSAVTTASKYESLINADFEHFARHHGITVFPARPHHPRDKPLVEGAVKIMYTRVLAPMRDQVFTSLAALNEAIHELLDSHNTALFKKLPYSRADLFASVDKPALKPLPPIRYELTHTRQVTVGLNYHVAIREDYHHYSVPFRYAKHSVTMLYSARTVEIWHDNQRIGFHVRATHPGYTTAPEHRPSHHKYYLEWTPERITAWAADVSPHIKTLVSVLLDRAEYPDQAYRACIGIINFSKKYPIERLDMAARIAIRNQSFSYQALKKILEKSIDLVESNADSKQLILTFHENLRGQAAYQ